MFSPLQFLDFAFVCELYGYTLTALGNRPVEKPVVTLKSVQKFRRNFLIAANSSDNLPGDTKCGSVKSRMTVK
jgi:hypothetical protein